MTTDLKEWYRSIPPITRWWFTMLVVIPLAGRFGIINPGWLHLDWHLFFSKGQIWRPITATFYYPINQRTGFHYLITLYFIYNYSHMLESGVFRGRPADYVWMLFTSWINCCIIVLAMDMYLLFDMSMFVVLYVWCMINKDEIVSFWFGTKFKASYFPWILLAFNLIIKNQIVSELSGICVGHLYFFLKYKYPIDFGGPSLLDTPRFVYKYFPSTRMTAGFGRTGQPLRPGGQDVHGGDNDDHQQYRRHVWGVGRRLDE